VSPRNLDPLKDLGEFIRGQLHQAEINLRKLADLAPVPVTGPPIERGLERRSAETLHQIARALPDSGISLRAGWDP